MRRRAPARRAATRADRPREISCECPPRLRHCVPLMCATTGTMRASAAFALNPAKQTPIILHLGHGNCASNREITDLVGKWTLAACDHAVVAAGTVAFQTSRLGASLVRWRADPRSGARTVGFLRVAGTAHNGAMLR